MTRIDAFRSCLHKVLDMATDKQIAEFLLSFARSPANDCDEIYNCWCDDQGACKGRDCEDLEYCCSDEEHLDCILRFLHCEVVPTPTPDN